MTTQTHQPWKPTCWVGGMFLTGKWVRDPWLTSFDQQLCELSDDSREKDAATEATAAILRAMRK